MRRKGELSKARIGRDWPHQIVLKANDVPARTARAMHAFCADLSLCPRGHAYVDNDAWMRAFFCRKGARIFA
jgi:hypothetical protein